MSSVLIINRSFWPVYPVLGDAFLRVACRLSENGHKVSCVFCGDSDTRRFLKKKVSNVDISFFACAKISGPDSWIFVRVFEALVFLCCVFGVLIRHRPTIVYVSTDPPLVVPLLVMLYCKITKSEYVYHVQDVHPEASLLVIGWLSYLAKPMVWIDNFVLVNSSRVIAISTAMASFLRKRCSGLRNLTVLNNPAAFGIYEISSKNIGFVFTGSAGRFQEIPLLVAAISAYLDKGGSLEFHFAGGGVYKDLLVQLDRSYHNVTYYGVVDVQRSIDLVCSFQWALLPIRSEVTQFSFPSKLSTYIQARSAIVCISDKDSAVSNWVEANNVGVIVPPDADKLVEFFFSVERGLVCFNDISYTQDFDFCSFVERLSDQIEAVRT